MRGWGAIAMGTLVFMTACAPVPQHRLVVTAAPQTSARLTLQLADVFQAARGVLYVEGSDKVKITIDGPGLADKPFEQTTMLQQGEKLVSLEKVPTGTHMVVTVQGLDASDVPIPGSLVRTAGAIQPGPNALPLSTEYTALGAVVTEILALDREKRTTVLSKVDMAALKTAMGQYFRALRAPHWALLDTKAIAKAVYDAAGVPPASPGAFSVKPGRVVVRPSDFPQGAHYLVSISDPASQPVLLSERKPLEIGPVAPGTWTLTLRSGETNLPVVTQSVTVTADGVTQAPVAFANSTALPAMPRKLSAGASAVVRVGTADTLVAVSGTSLDDAGALIGVTSILTYSPAAGWTNRTPLSFDLSEAAAASHGGKVYFFGGTVGNGTMVGAARRYDPATGVEPTSLDPLPDDLTLQGAAAAAIGDTLYIAGGVTDADGTLNTEMIAYDPLTGDYSDATLPAFTPGRVRPATAVVDGKWYTFGGMIVAVGSDQVPLYLGVSTSQVFTPGANAKWDDLPLMPTPRYAAGTVVVDGKIWVIGGATLLGTPSSAVEVFDTATSKWSTRPPLKTPRANPACGYLNGKIIVAGGAMGGDATVAIPVSDVEELKP